ncbi:polysaccharide deacetylase family protein [Clostridium ganghwense]|uniref:Polysaccharide deacetylase family protein n=1 Tax=Clostridium ganghwense TaxID=312089 RepID=A0ABT4CSE7_9CLOT|nr:polysaccharide deacetylase family protein [Clostridium ganghwense]MCY6370996.1 polysaccharide deacetylase family protein [Clostridium ganghwense]
MKRKFSIYYIILSILFFCVGCSNDKPTVSKISSTVLPVSSTIPSKTALVKEDKKTEVNAAKTAPLTKREGGIPVLMYHSIGFEKDNPVRLPVKNLEKQMKYLKDNNYTTLSLDEVYDYFQNNKPIPEKSIVLTFDDGYLDNYTKLYAVMKKYEFKGTIFVITKAINNEKDYLTSKQLKELENNNLSIESHTACHENLSELSYDKQLKTLKNSKEFLEKTLNKKVKYIAYPYGKYNKDTLKAVKEAGYVMAFTTDGKWSDKSDGILTLDRVYVSGFFDMDTFINRVTNPNYEYN